MKKRVTVKSSLFVLIIVAFLLCFAIYKLFYVALASKVDGVNLKVFAENRNTKTKPLYASRGTIYDNKGDILALSVNSYKLIAYLEPSRTTDPKNPEHVVDKEKTAKELAPILGLEEEKILEYLNKDAYQVEFGSKGRNLTEITKKQIDKLNLPGLDFEVSTQRYYKMGNFASYIIGYAKTYEDGSIVGELGLEEYFNRELSGKDGKITYQSDAYGYRLPNVPAMTEEAISGSDIHLTIDSSIQLICENGMKELDDNFDFDWALMTIVDAKTGAILASTTSPSFNPNNLNTLESYLNPLVSYTYEPGSTMKIFSWASAIEEGVYDGEDTYKSGSIEVADFTISDHNKNGWGVISYDRGFAMSSNVAATKLAQKLGRDKLAYYYDHFGFGKKTGIELSGEVTGSTNFVYETEVATAAFGQGVLTVTPIQMIQALTMIAGDGVMLRPYVVDKIVSEDGTVTYEGSKNEVGQMMKKETAKKMRDLMYIANYDGLTKMWQPKKVSMSMKTGTAQITSDTGGYLDGEFDNIYSVAGIFPSEKPEYIVYAAVKRIIGAQKDVANMVTKAVDEIATYANITEEETVSSENSIINVGQYISKKTDDIKNELQDKLNVITLGTGEYIVDQYPLNGSKLVKGSKIYLVTNNDEYKMLDIYGWSLSDVKNYAKLANIKVKSSGYGYVTSQSIVKDTELKKDMTLEIKLESKRVKDTQKIEIPEEEKEKKEE